jgi:hypothetical protein
MIMDKCYIIHTLYNRELERDADERVAIDYLPVVPPGSL